MIKALLFDFSWVMVFPKPRSGPRAGGVSQTYHQQIQHQAVSEFLDFNHELLEWIAQKEIPSYVLSASSPEMLAALRSSFVPPFLDMFSTKKLGMSKHDPDTFSTIAKKIKIKPAHILFTDDNVGNIEAAQQAGLQTVHYQSNQDFFTQAADYDPSLV